MRNFSTAKEINDPVPLFRSRCTQCLERDGLHHNNLAYFLSTCESSRENARNRFLPWLWDTTYATTTFRLSFFTALRIQRI